MQPERTQDESRACRRALLVATDQYSSGSLARLRTPSHDIRALSRVLGDPAIGDFSVTQALNRPAHEITAAIEDFFSEKRADDVLLLYFSCHGVKDDAGRLFFAATGTHLNRLASSAVPASFVAEQIRLSSSRKIILLLDCCYSGAFTEGLLARGGDRVEIDQRLGGAGRAIIYSSAALEYAFELDTGNATKKVSPTAANPSEQLSVFTRAIVEGLSTGEADRDKDGRISVDELYDYAYAAVAETTPKQTPGKFIDVHGELFVARSLHTAPPPSLPEEVMSAVRHPLPSVRHAIVETLRGLADLGGEKGRLAYDQLVRLLDDDSRSVAARARQAVEAIGRPGDGPHAGAGRPRAGSVPPPPPAPPPPPRAQAPPPGPHRPRSAGMPPGYVIAYLLPVFTSLFLMFSKNRETRFHALQCAFVDVLAIVYFFVSAIAGGIYSSVRYGDEPIPQDGPMTTVVLIIFLALPCVLRVFCLVKLARHRRPCIKYVGTFASRLAYRSAAG